MTASVVRKNALLEAVLSGALPNEKTALLQAARSAPDGAT